VNSLKARSHIGQALRLLLVLAAAALPHDALASSDLASLIVANQGIGPFHLGMSAGEIQVLRRNAPCEVQVSFAAGRASRLETNCGGAFRTAEYVQVGIGPDRILWFYGRPDRVTASDYANVRGEWLSYDAGIAFRVVYGDGSSALIQAIAVFPGSGRLFVRQQPGTPPGTAPPVGIGE
jgi:hypothetical protein